MEVQNKLTEAMISRHFLNMSRTGFQVLTWLSVITKERLVLITLWVFNAPIEIADAMKDTGYDVVDLAHNHILDSGLSGAINTVETFENLGLSTIGVYKENRDTEDILIKNVNGIKIAILGYYYGYNGMEANVADEDYEKHMSDLDEDKMKSEIQEAEKKADVTIVMSQMGTEYALEPTDERVRLLS